MPADDIGLAIIGCGAIGRARAELAREHPAVGWIGLCDIDANSPGPRLRRAGRFHYQRLPDTGGAPRGERRHRGNRGERTSTRSLLRPKQATRFAGKPLATNPIESEKWLAAITDLGINAVVGSPSASGDFPAARRRINDRYGLEIGIGGTRGVIDIEDTHRDAVPASDLGQGAGYKTKVLRTRRRTRRRISSASTHPRISTTAPRGDRGRRNHDLAQPPNTRMPHPATRQPRTANATSS